MMNMAGNIGGALSPLGEQVREQAFALLVDCEERFLTPLAGEQRAQLTELLSRVVEL